MWCSKGAGFETQKLSKLLRNNCQGQRIKDKLVSWTDYRVAELEDVYANPARKMTIEHKNRPKHIVNIESTGD